MTENPACKASRWTDTILSSENEQREGHTLLPQFKTINDLINYPRFQSFRFKWTKVCRKPILESTSRPSFDFGIVVLKWYPWSRLQGCLNYDERCKISNNFDLPQMRRGNNRRLMLIHICAMTRKCFICNQQTITSQQAADQVWNVAG